MTQIEETLPQFEGTFVRKGDDRYEKLRIGHVFNQRLTSRMPAAILLPASEDDVVAGVELAARMGWQVSVRAGGHSWASWGVRDGALLIDLSSVKDMELDPATNIVWASPAVAGATELDPYLADRGRFFPVGHCESVGIGGFLLQGGMGWHIRHYGWSCESIQAIDVVLADGTKVRASEDDHADLLWAARGAGPGFPGIITRFHLKTSPRPVFVMDTRTFHLEDLDDLLTWLQGILPDLDRRWNRFSSRRACRMFRWTRASDGRKAQLSCCIPRLSATPRTKSRRCSLPLMHAPSGALAACAPGPASLSRIRCSRCRTPRAFGGESTAPGPMRWQRNWRQG
jgi:hypothetical protein